jgi:hypothetical protein
MVTADEIAGVGIFAGLDPADRERLARASPTSPSHQANTRRTR